ASATELGARVQALFELVDIAAEAVRTAQRTLEESDEQEWRGRREALLAMLTLEQPPRQEALRIAARQAGWPLPKTVSVLVMDRPPDAAIPIVSPSVLADWNAQPSYLVLPDHRGDAPLPDIDWQRAALGPSVPPERAGVSLRWALRTLDLGSERQVARCDENLPALIARSSRELLELLAPTRLAGLLELPATRRERLWETLQAFLTSGRNVAATARLLTVHPQTVHYRIRNLEQVLGPILHDQQLGLELQLLLLCPPTSAAAR
ncbi:PucR family transcriptional regulator, partial [Actinocorallia lasiicapitis]